MIELEPVTDVRVFVPTSGDILMHCAECGRGLGMVSGDSEVGFSEMQQIPTSCCGADRVARKVP